MDNVIKLEAYTAQDFMRDFIEFARSPADWSVLHQDSEYLITSTSRFEVGPGWAGCAETTIGDKIAMKSPMCCIRSATGRFVVISPEMNEHALRYESHDGWRKGT